MHFIEPAKSTAAKGGKATSENLTDKTKVVDVRDMSEEEKKKAQEEADLARTTDLFGKLYKK